MRAPPRLLPFAAAGLALLAGCTSREKKEPEARPVRFAVISAPEIGSDDGDLALAVTSLSLEKDLAFVLVPGPLLASDADETSLELLKNDLGQVSAPVYVAFSSTAPVSSAASAARPSRLTKEKIAAALETLGPGATHAVSYSGHPERAPGVVVNVLAPDGSGALAPLPPETKRLVQLVATEGEIGNADALEADVLVARTPPGEASGPPFALVQRQAARADEQRFPKDAVELRVVPLSRSRQVVVATLEPGSIRVSALPLEAKDAKPGPIDPVRLPLPAPRTVKGKD